MPVSARGLFAPYTSESQHRDSTIILFCHYLAVRRGFMSPFNLIVHRSLMFLQQRTFSATEKAVDFTETRFLHILFFMWLGQVCFICDEFESRNRHATFYRIATRNLIIYVVYFHVFLSASCTRFTIYTLRIHRVGLKRTKNDYDTNIHSNSHGRSCLANNFSSRI